jgi:hypothetical protein
MGVFDSFDPNMFDAVTDMEAVPEGPYLLQIADTPTRHESEESGKSSIFVQLAVKGHEETAWPIRHYIAIPTDEEYAAFTSGVKNDDARRANAKLSMAKQFMKSFDIPPTAFAPEQWATWSGKEANALVGVEDYQGRPQNRVVRFL